MRQIVSSLVQAAGVSLLAIAGFLISEALGFAVVGLGVFAAGLSMERR